MLALALGLSTRSTDGGPVKIGGGGDGWAPPGGGGDDPTPFVLATFTGAAGPIDEYQPDVGPIAQKWESSFHRLNGGGALEDQWGAFGFFTWDSAYDGAEDASDGVIELTINQDEGGGLVFRLTDKDNYWRLAVETDVLVLYRVTAGVSSGVATSADWEIAYPLTLRAVLNGPSIQCTALSVPGIGVSTNDSFNKNATKHGVFKLGTGGTADNYSHYPLS